MITSYEREGLSLTAASFSTLASMNGPELPSSIITEFIPINGDRACRGGKLSGSGKRAGLHAGLHKGNVGGKARCRVEVIADHSESINE